MNDDEVARIAELLHRRNTIDDQIAAIIGRPMANRTPVGSRRRGLTIHW